MKNDRKEIFYLFDERDWKTRLPVAQKAIKNGHDVRLILIASDDDKTPKELKKYAYSHIFMPERTIGKRSLFSFIRQLNTLIKEHDPDLLHCVTIKYAFAAGLETIFRTKIKRLYTLAGLGFLFRSRSKKAFIIRTILRPLFRLLFLNKNTNLIFQNPDDRSLFIDLGFTNEEKSHLIRGSGVDLKTFSPAESKLNNKNPVVLLPTRLVKEKGIDIFIAAAKILQQSGTNAKFQIAGSMIAHNPKAITKEQMHEMLKNSPVEWLGRVENMPALYQSADLIVYPSSYGEGIPRVLLESAACGLPVITTDHPGCKEAVDNGKNGLLIPINDPESCARAIDVLLKNPEERSHMGTYSRQKAEREFDINNIAAQTVKLYKL